MKGKIRMRSRLEELAAKLAANPKAGRNRKLRAKMVRLAEGLGMWNLKHGLYKSPEYRAWANMKDRCNNLKSRCYSDYGGRGIRVCRRWNSSNGFISFLSDMGKRPSALHSLNRIDNDGDYCPENCRWDTYVQQNRNHRGNHILTHEGLSLCITAWAERVGIAKQTILSRIRNGWPHSHAIMTPTDVRYSTKRKLSGEPDDES